jgi:hypothetical protein
MAKRLDTDSLAGVFAAIKQEIGSAFYNLTAAQKAELKLKFSDLTVAEKEEITGPQGPQGDSFQPIEDASGLVLAHTLGNDNTKAMSQKGVSDEMISAKYRLGTPLDLSGYSDVSRFINSSGKWTDAESPTSIFIPISDIEGDKLLIHANSDRTADIAFLTSDSHVKSQDASFVPGTAKVTVSPDVIAEVDIPTGTQFMYVNKVYASYTKTPASIVPVTLLKDEVSQGIAKAENAKAEADEIGEMLGYEGAGTAEDLTYTSFSSFPQTNVAAMTSAVNVNSISAVVNPKKYRRAVLAAGSSYSAVMAFATAYSTTSITFCSALGRVAVTKDTTETFTIPNDCKYIILTLFEDTRNANYNRTPASLSLQDGVGEASLGRLDNIERRLSGAAVGGVDARFVKVCNKMCKYVLEQICDANYAGTVTITKTNTFSGSSALNPLNAANAAVALAKLLATGLIDNSIISHSNQQIEEYLHKIVVADVNAHVANASGGWGNAWQSPLVAGSLANCVILMPDLFSASEKEAVKDMLLSECDYVMSITSQSLLYWKDENGTELNVGDTKSEECYWNAMPLGAALVLCTDAQNYDDIAEAFVRLNIIGGSTPSDSESWKTISGFQLSSLNGSNVQDNGIIINHNRVHPHYMVAMECSIFETLGTMAHVGFLIPEGAIYGKDRIAKALHDVEFENTEYDTPYEGNGGTIYQPGNWNIYYPQGNDWSSPNKIAINEAAFDKCIKEMGLDTSCDWDAWAGLHLTLPEYLQDRHEDGHLYEDGETTIDAVRRELSAAQQVTTVLLFICNKIRITTSQGWASEDHYDY